LQPDHEITLFNGQGGEFKAVVTHMGRSEVSVRVGEHHPVERELNIQVHLWSSITANERMDWLLEKATELGAATLLPITAERSVLKLKGKPLRWLRVSSVAAIGCCKWAKQSRSRKPLSTYPLHHRHRDRHAGSCLYRPAPDCYKR
jgi:16S rRNA (uracil1498-N3)-methyltransferase